MIASQALKGIPTGGYRNEAMEIASGAFPAVRRCIWNAYASRIFEVVARPQVRQAEAAAQAGVHASAPTVYRCPGGSRGQRTEQRARRGLIDFFEGTLWAVDFCRNVFR